MLLAELYSPSYATKYANRNGYRLRVGNYRVLFDAETEVRIIEIQEVKKRDSNTY